MKGKSPNSLYTSHPGYGPTQILLHVLIRCPNLGWNNRFWPIADGSAVVITPCAVVGRVKGGGETANRELSCCEEVFSDVQTKTLDVIVVAVDIASHGLQLWNLLRDGVLIDIQCERAKDLRRKNFAEMFAC